MKKAKCKIRCGNREQNRKREVRISRFLFCEGMRSVNFKFGFIVLLPSPAGKGDHPKDGG